MTSADPTRRPLEGGAAAVGPSTAGGLLLVDKPAGVTSHDVVAAVRRAAGTRRVGHAGTLDPFATGLLVVAVGPVTRLLPYVVGEPKVYEATIRFGAATDTDDSTGQVVREAPVPAGALDSHSGAPLHEAVRALTGPLQQRPPAFSAKHVGGTRAYALARRGEAVDLPPVPVTVDRWELLGRDGNDLRVRIHCGAGTYIRALARDLGERLGTAAHCLALRRVRSGPLSVGDAVPADALVPGAVARGEVALRSPLAALGDVAHEPLDADGMARLRHGQPVPATVPGTRAALVRDGVVQAVAERAADGRWQPRVVLAGEVA